MKKFGFNFWTVFLPFHIWGAIALFELSERMEKLHKEF